MNKIHFDKKHPENHTIAQSLILNLSGSIRKKMVDGNNVIKI